MADEQPDNFGSELDRLEQILTHRDSELQRLRTELALKTLYVDELQAGLDAQAREMEAFDERLRKMEAQAGRDLQPAAPVSRPITTASGGKPVPFFIRIRKSIRH